MSTIIQYTKKAFKGKEELSQDERDILEALEQDLRDTAGKPLGRGWRGLGPVRQYAPNAYHCAGAWIEMSPGSSFGPSRASPLAWGRGLKGVTQCTIRT